MDFEVEEINEISKDGWNDYMEDLGIVASYIIGTNNTGENSKKIPKWENITLNPLAEVTTLLTNISYKSFYDKYEDILKYHKEKNNATSKTTQSN
jgi:hypothetical protein